MDRIERVKTALAHREPDVVPTISCIDVQKHIYDILGETPDNSYKYFINPITAPIITATAPLLNRLGLFERDVREFMFKKLTSDVVMGYDATWALYANIFLIKDSRHMTDIFGRLYKIVDDGYGNMDTPMYIDGMLRTPEDWRRLPKKNWERFPEKMFQFNENDQEGIRQRHLPLRISPLRYLGEHLAAVRVPDVYTASQEGTLVHRRGHRIQQELVS